MVKKITYSRRQPDKRRLSFDFDQVRENDDGRKRTKTAHESDEVQFVTPASKTRAKKPLVSKKSAFGGPVSIPDDADLEPSPRSGNRLSVFDKVLSNGRHQPEKTDENSLQANKQQFSEMMKIGQRSREHNDQKSKRYLPTPPAEVQRKGHDEVQEDEGFVRLNGYADKDGLNTPETSPTPSTRTFQLFGQARKNAPREPYQPRAYKALLTPAPREKIGGSLLSRESRETQLWSTNQVSSPFLQLPQNVRDIIYRYTLGGKTVNINYETYRITFDPTRPQVAKKVMPVFKYNCTVIDGKMNPFQAAAKPYIKIRKSFTLLNSVCRQLYVETATLPYKLNMMCFASHNIMVNFVLMEKRLSREQLDALTQLLLRNELPGPNLLACLRNLEKVYLVSDQSGKSSGWYHVEREEGKEPNLVQAPKGRA